MSNMYYLSTRNAMKRDPSSGSADMAAPSTSAYSGTVYVTNKTIPHNLGKTPVFRYYSEPFGDGVIWPPLSDRLSGASYNPNDLTQKGPGIIGWADNTNLYLQLFYFDNTLTGTFPVYWVLYRDFGL